MADDGQGASAAAVIRLLAAQGKTVGTAESLTGGLIAAALTSVPGASAAFVGGIVAYSAEELKISLLGVSGSLIDRVGTVDREVAIEMARGARHRLGASFAVAVTGVAGPDPVGDLPPGTVHVAVSSVSRDWHRRLLLSGDRMRIRDDTVMYALRLLVNALSEDNR